MMVNERTENGRAASAMLVQSHTQPHKIGETAEALEEEDEQLS